MAWSWEGHGHPPTRIQDVEPPAHIHWPNSPTLSSPFSFSIMSLFRTTHSLPFKTLAVLNRQATSFLFLPLTSLPLTQCNLLHSSFLIRWPDKCAHEESPHDNSAQTKPHCLKCSHEKYPHG
jgi:hypothetical protein